MVLSPQTGNSLSAVTQIFTEFARKSSIWDTIHVSDLDSLLSTLRIPLLSHYKTHFHKANLHCHCVTEFKLHCNPYFRFIYLYIVLNTQLNHFYD
jgi:hypothetical protein